MDDMCTDNRFELIERFKKKLIESTNIETSPEEMKAIDNLLFRFWQMGWLDIIDRMPLVKESAKTLMHSDGNSVSAKAFRNAGRFIQNAIDGEAPEFEKIPSAQPERKRGKWIHGKELSREMMGDCVVAIRYDGWRCSKCGCLVEQERKPLYKYCPNCGDAKGGDEE